MTLVGPLRKWLVATPITGKPALMFAVAAVALPTIYRLALDDVVMGIGYCPYLPSAGMEASDRDCPCFCGSCGHLVRGTTLPNPQGTDRHAW
jgi:hypothetical protein